MTILKNGLFTAWAAVFVLASAAAHAQADACHPQTPPQSAYGANPITTYMIAALAPDKLIGWNFEPPPQVRGYLADALMARPVVGGWFGHGKTPNLETLAAIKPQVSLTSTVTVSTDRSIPVLEKLGLPVCNLTLNRVEDYPAAFRLGGGALGVDARGEALARMAEDLIAARKRTAASDPSPKPRIYYAEGVDGLATECAGSVHAEVIELAGAQNVHRCPASVLSDRFGMVRIDFEQLAAYDPDWIVTQESNFVRKLGEDARWQSLRAVREGRVLLAPQAPFRWLDRPPSYMRLLAMHWLAERIQPKPYPLDVSKATQDFFALFFQRELDAQAVQAVLNPEVR